MKRIYLERKSDTLIHFWGKKLDLGLAATVFLPSRKPAAIFLTKLFLPVLIFPSHAGIMETVQGTA